MANDYRFENEDGILTLTFTRDQKLNAISTEMVDAVREAVFQLGNDPEARVLVITAEGRFFSAGLDISQMPPERDKSGVTLRRIYRNLHLIFDEMEAIEKPIILAAQGPCLGVGLEMASSVDFRFASPRTYFSLPEIITLGVIPGSGGISRFTRLVGPHWARWVAMAGKSIPAEQAKTIGLVHDVFEEDVFAESVQAFARDLRGLSKEALGLAKIAIDTAASADKITARNVDRMANTLLFKTEEYTNSVNAFNARSSKKS